MAPASHIIGSMQFQLDVSDSGQAEVFYEKISRLSHEALPNLLNKVLDDLDIPPEQHIRIDHLAIDTGALDADEFESELLKRLEMALRKSLADVWPSLPATPGKASSDGQTLAALAFLLEFGHLPWWVSRDALTGESLETWWLEMLQTHRDQAGLVVRQLLRPGMARQRLVQQLSIQTLRKTVEVLLEQSPEGSLVRFLNTLHLVAARQYPHQRPETLVWSTALHQLLATPPGDTGIRSLWDGISLQLAGTSGDSQQVVQHKLVEALRQMPEWTPDLLPATADRANPPVLAPAIQSYINAVAKALESHYPGRSTDALFWQSTLRYLFTNPGMPLSIPELQEALIPRISKAYNVPPGEIRRLFDGLQEEEGHFFRVEPEETLGEMASPTVLPDHESAGLTPEQQLLAYLEHGHFPAGNRTAMAALEHALRELVYRFPQKTRELLYAIHRQTDVGARIAGQFSTDVQQVVIEGLFPTLAPAIRAFVKRIGAELSVQYPADQFESLLWQMSLTFLLNNPALPFSIRTFKRSLVDRLSGHLRLSPAQTLELLGSMPDQEDESSDIIPVDLITLPGTLEVKTKSGAAMAFQAEQTRPASPESDRLAEGEKTSVSGREQPYPTSDLSPASAEALLFAFLESGRLPEGAAATLTDLEQTLQDLLRRFPQMLLQQFIFLQQKTDMVTRVARQFSEELLREVAETLVLTREPALRAYFNAMLPNVAQQWPGRDVEPQMWQAVLEYGLTSPTVPLAIATFEATLVSRLAETLEIPEAEIRPKLPVQSAIPNPQSEIRNPQSEIPNRQIPNQSELPASAEALLFAFLESGRLPEGAGATLDGLEQTLQDLLRRFPKLLLQQFIFLQQKTDVVTRVARQFSKELLRELAETLVLAREPALQTYFNTIMPAMAQQWPGRDVEPLLWQIVLEYGLTSPTEPLTVATFEAILVSRLAETLGIPEAEIRPIFPVQSAIPNPQSAIRNPQSEIPNQSELPASAEALLFTFLESDRLPEGAGATLAGLEQTLQELLRRFPQLLLQQLLFLQQKTVDVVTRVAHQFSKELLRELAETLVLARKPALQTYFNTMMPAVAQQWPGRDVEPLLWQIVLEYGLTSPTEPLTVATFEAILVSRLVETLGIPEAEIRPILPVQSAIRNPQSEIRNPQSQIPNQAELPASAEALLFAFLESGRLPEGAAATLTDLEQTLQELLRRFPQLLLQQLLFLQQKTDVVTRVAHQFSKELLRELAERLVLAREPALRAYFNAMLPNVAQQWPGRDVESQMWQAVLEYRLTSPTEPLTVATFEAILVSRLAETLGIPEAEIRPILPIQSAIPNPQSAIRNPKSQIPNQTELPASAEALLFAFLESGRLPEGAGATLAGLEQTLQDLLRRFPQMLKQQFVFLQQKTVDVVTRVARQFSEELLRELAETLVLTREPALRAYFNAMLPNVAQQWPGRDVESQMWQAVLEYGLTSPTEPLTVTTFEAILVSRLAETLGISETEIQPILPVQSAIPNPQSQIRNPQSQIPNQAELPASAEALLFAFLESGRLPEGAGATLAGLEQTLQDLLRRFPQLLLQQFIFLQQKTDVVTRVAHQFSKELLREVAETLVLTREPALRAYFNAMLPNVAQQWPGRDVESQMWQTVLEYGLTSPTEPLTVATFEATLVSRLAETLEIPEAEIRPILPVQSAIQNPKSAIPNPQSPIPNQPALFFFLEWSRMPAGESTSASDLEKMLLTALQDTPDIARKELLYLRSKVNLADRLIRHFSLSTLRRVVQVVFESYWTDLEVLLNDLSGLPPKFVVLGADFPAMLWKNAIAFLFAPSAPGVYMTELTAYLFGRLEEQGALRGKLSPTSSVIKDLQKSGFHPSTLGYITIALGRITPAEQQALEAAIRQQHRETSGFSVEHGVAQTALDRILYRLGHGKPAWWDATEDTPGTLVEALARFPATALRTSLRQLWDAGFQHKWLPALPETAFNRLLQTLWGDYAILAEVYVRLFSDAAAGLGVPAIEPVIRQALLEQAITPAPVNSSRLYRSILGSVVRHSQRPESDWKKFLEYQTDLGVVQGDIRFHRIREIMLDTEEPAVQTPVPPEGVAAPSPGPLDKPGQLPSYAVLLRIELEAVTHFLHFGTLPSKSLEIGQAAELEQRLLRLIDRHAPLVLPLFLDAFARQGRVEKLIQAISAKVWHAIARLIWGGGFGSMLELWHQLRDRLVASGFKTDPTKLERYFFAHIFETAGISGRKTIEAETLVENLVGLIAGKEQIPDKILWEHLKTVHPGHASRPDRVGELLPALLKRREEALRTVAAKPKFAATTQPQDEAILVPNAGLVILALYLPRFFGTMGLLENQQFKDEAAAERGVHLLQYLATNQTETPEHQLVLNKVLCGLPIQTPVRLGIAITSEEKDLAAFLLNSVIQNWEMMKNSTVANLQGAFLLREGLLREKDENWQLHVEKKGFDIVLDYLPWTISIVKLPWMEKRIEVEWKKKT